MDQKRKMKRKYIRLKTTLVFIFIFLAVWCVIWIINQSQERREKLKATYTAESTVSRVESQLSKYLAESDLMKQIVEKEYDIDNEQFDKLAELMQEDEDVIEARELAEDGVVSRIYPMEGNEAAMGLDTLQNPARKKEARLARLSGEYTIAGPYELVQGGTGALLFDPAYITDQNGEEKFWGFSILVMNWDNFIQEVELEKLEEAGYDYQIWKKDLYTGEKIVIDESENSNLNNSLEVACSVPNDTWYFEIVPENGWITVSQKVFGVIISIALAVMASVGYWQYKMRRYKDILHEEELEKAAIEARMANEAKTRFLFYMSHDIRTPMNAIVGFTALATTHIGNTELVLDYLNKIHTSSQHLLSLINDVLDMSRIESGSVRIEYTTVHLPDILHDLRTIIQGSVHSKQQDLYIDTQDVIHEDIITDKLRLTQVLLNICSNAVKFTPVGGMINIRVSEKPCRRDGYITVVFSVKDNGIGMSREFRKHVFDSFSREHTVTENGIGGTGLGMAITKNIVDMMDGTIQVESETGKGTEFTIMLECETSGETVKREPVPELKGARALVVDDDAQTCMSVSRMLREIEMTADWTTSGKEAVLRAKEAYEQNQEFKVYIIDWLMPDMNGIETVRRIRMVVGKEYPIIILTAYDWSDVEQEAREAGVTAFVSKPLFLSELREVLMSQAQRELLKNEKQKDQAKNRKSYAGKKVLLVEDNELNREIATAIMKEMGLEVDTAEDGTDAVNIMSSAEGRKYDLIFMDIQMPKMDGYIATREIRTLNNHKCANIPIIAMTANAFEEDRKKAVKAGMNGHIAKPISADVILENLDQIFEG